ncbi:MAG: hypothetical protein ACJA2W_000934 [Planctomycetota bacterium]|jgi:hypothetical protein
MISNLPASAPLIALLAVLAGVFAVALPYGTPGGTQQPAMESALASAWGLPQEPGARSETPAAAAEDVDSLDAIIAALYDVISGEKIGPDGENQRDWDRFLSLFHPELGRLIPLAPDVKDPANPTWRAIGMSPAGYVERGSSFMGTTAFYEKEIHRVEEVFGGIAHAWSTYEGRNTRDAEEAFLRGVNSIQAMYDGERWWLLVVAWDAERPDQPLPAKYLPKK